MSGPKLRVGDALPVLEREGSIHHWNRFAAVNDEFADHHWDDAVARAEGFPAAFAMAPLQQSLFHALLRDWMGLSGRIVRLDMKLRHPFLRGRTLRVGGRVNAVWESGGERLAGLELWMTDDEEHRIAPGSATVAWPR